MSEPPYKFMHTFEQDSDGQELSDFMAAESVSPRAELSRSITATIHKKLNPPGLWVFAKLYLTHACIGLFTLMLCPHFGVSLIPGFEGITPYLLQVGHTFCMTICGVLVISPSLLYAAFRFKSEQLKVCRHFLLIQIPTLTLLTLAILHLCGGQAVVIAHVLPWVLGGIIGGILTFEIGIRMNKNFLLTKLHRLIILLAMGAMLEGHAQMLTPELVLKEVYTQNPQLASYKAKAQAEDFAIASTYALDSPRVGWMRSQNMTLMQVQNGPMNVWTASQDILFPPKYFSKGSAQRAKARAAEQDYLDKKLLIRQKALSTYYDYYAARKILSLLDAQRSTLKEIARIAEARRATGGVPQQDEMKAHVEQTKLENDVLLQEQEVIEFQTSLNALLNREVITPIDLPLDDIQTPKLQHSLEDIHEVASVQSKAIASQNFMLQEAQKVKDLALWNYFPDFRVSYSRQFGSNSPANAYTIGVEISIPLWFFAKESSMVASAGAKVWEAEKQLEHARANTASEAKSISAKVQTLSKLLTIYETTLIPQATTMLNSSRSAYSTGKVSFQDLLDSERVLYSVRIDYYRHLSKYVTTLTRLERVAGQALSSLPYDGESL